MDTLAKSSRTVRFCVLAGVEDVRIVGNDVVGRFQANLKEFYGPPHRRLIEDFLNWPHDPENVLRFTRKYGPLKGTPVEGTAFAVSWFPWYADQRVLQNLWRNRNILRSSASEPVGGSLELRQGWLTCTAPDLYTFLYLDLVTCEAKRLRVCKRTTCPHPYFIARHLKQQFCDEKCAQWGQRQWKKSWWEKHGAAWRQERRESKLKKKGGRNVTHKTR